MTFPVSIVLLTLNALLPLTPHTDGPEAQRDDSPSLSSIVTASAERLGRTILFDRRELDRLPVDLTGPLPEDLARLEVTFETCLAAHGCALLRPSAPDAPWIVRSTRSMRPEDRALARLVTVAELRRDDSPWQRRPASWIVTPIALHHRNAMELMNVLGRGFGSRPDGLLPLPDGRTLIATGTASAVLSLLDLLGAIDRADEPQGPATIVRLPLKSITAVEASQHLQRYLSGRLAMAGPGARAHRPTVYPLPQSSALVVEAPVGELEAVRAFVRALDQ